MISMFYPEADQERMKAVAKQLLSRAREARDNLNMMDLSDSTLSETLGPDDIKWLTLLATLLEGTSSIIDQQIG